MMAYFFAEAEEEERISALRSKRLLPREVLESKGALVDGLNTKNLKLLADNANQLLDSVGDDEDKEILYPDILTVRGETAFLNDVLQFETKDQQDIQQRFQKDPSSLTEEELNDLVALDFVYFASEVDPTVTVDSKIKLCNRRVKKEAVDDEEEGDTDTNEENEKEETEVTNAGNESGEQDESNKRLSGGKSSDWQLFPFSLTDWMEREACHLLIEEEGSFFSSFSFPYL
jgi:hypothetical protein